ncbi:MAG: redoxin domain-containing protein [Planctomycetes bacterium]|nr:redoxin domain-containing protein [Planctomycetota bacterium]
MFNLRNPWRSAAFAVLACLLVAGIDVGANDVKKEEKKKASTASKFTGKTIDLKLKDGKLDYTTEFTADDPKALTRFHYKVFTVQLVAGKLYRIDHKGTGDDAKFDPYLFLEDADGNTLEQDDDGGGGLNARIIHKAAKSGTYRIVATTFVANQTGKFALVIGAPDAGQAKLAELKFSISKFADLSPAQRKKLVEDVNKHLVNKDGDLNAGDFQITLSLGMEAEFENLDLARDLYKEAIKQFSAAKNQQIATGVTRQFENALKGLDKLGKPIEITGKTTAGKDFDLTKMKGKVVLVDFWATWCGPCIAELPNMEKAYAKYHGKGFDIIGISLDRPGDEEKLTKFMEGRKMPWPCINIEDSRKLADLHKVQAIPYPVLVDREGRVVSFRARGPALERMLARLLKDSK